MVVCLRVRESGCISGHRVLLKERCDDWLGGERVPGG